MEEYKDVMLSEPPSRFQQNNAPAIHAVSLENYKGILLCDRPANIVGANRGGQGGDGVAPFLPSGKVEEKQLGLQPTQEQRARMELCRNMRVSQSKDLSKASNPALSKHRRWLRSFAQAVREMKLTQAEQLQRQDEFKNRVKEAQADQRQKRLAGGPNNASDDEKAQPEKAATGTPTLPPVAKESPTTAGKPDGKTKIKGSKKGSKPKWAMTEDEALDAELTEHLKLVKFAKELDFDKFIQDYEVQEALSIMRDRVQELAKEHGIDLDTAKESALNAGDDDDDFDNLSMAPSDASTTTREVYAQRLAKKKAKKIAAETAALLADASAAQHANEWNKSTSVGDIIRTAISQDALELADKILSTSESMRRIHTRNSLAKLLQNVCLQNSTTGLAGQSSQQQDIANVGSAVPPPVMASVAAEATGLQKDASDKRILTKLRLAKDKTQNLPYLYRCPSL